MVIPACQAATVCSCCPEVRFPIDAGLKISLDDFFNYGCGQCRTLLQFPLSAIPKGMEPKNATIYLSPIKGNLKAVRAFRNLSQFEGREVTWRTRPKTEKAPFASSYASEDGLALNALPALEHCEDFLGVTLETKSPGSLLVREAPYLRLRFAEGQEGGDKHVVSNIFSERRYSFSPSFQLVRYSPVYDASSSATLTFFVKNTGDHPFAFNIQISPDGEQFMDDLQAYTVNPGELMASSPYLFGRFMRVKIVASQPDVPTAADIWIQAQTENYIFKKI